MSLFVLEDLDDREQRFSLGFPLLFHLLQQASLCLWRKQENDRIVRWTMRWPRLDDSADEKCRRWSDGSLCSPGA